MDRNIINFSKEEKKPPQKILLPFFKSEFFVKLVIAGVSVFVLVFSTFSLFQIRKLNTKYSFEQFFPAKHKLLERSRENRLTFQLEDHPSFLLVLDQPESKTWMDPNEMAQLKVLTQEIARLKQIHSALSIATLEGARSEGDALAIGPLFEAMPQTKWAEFTSKNSLLRNQLVSEDFRSVLISIEPVELSTKDLGTIRDYLEKLSQYRFPQAKVAIGGTPALQAQLSELLAQEIKKFSVMSLLIFTLVFAVFFEGWIALLLTFLSLAFVNLAIVGILCYLQIPFSVLLSTLPIIVSVALISVLIHTLHRWSQVADVKAPLTTRFFQSWSVVKEMLLPNFLGSLTTSLGFIPLVATPIPLIKQYGWVVAGCVLAAWMLTQILLLGFMCLIQTHLRPWGERKARWSLIILKYAKPLAFTLVVVTAAFISVAPRATFSSRLHDDLPSKNPAQVATDRIDESFGGSVTSEWTLRGNKTDFWKIPGNLKKLEASLQKIRQVPVVGSAVSLSDFMTEGIPKKKAAISELIFMYSLAEENPLRHFVTDNGKMLRMALRFHDMTSDELRQGRKEIRQILNSKFGDDIKIEETGAALSAHHINREVSKDLIFNFWHSILLVGIILCFVFRSVRWAALACLPNLIPPAFLIGILALTHTPIKPGIALVFSIALGLAFNNTVYFLSRLKKLQRLHFAAPRHILKQAFLQEGNPCLFETVIMFCGFSLFLTSGFKINQIFGLYMLLSIVAGALGDLVFLPSLLKIFPGLWSKKTEEVEAPQDEELSKVAASIAVFAFIGLLFASPKAHAQVDPQAKAILKQTQAQLEAKDDQATVVMKIIEANGEIKSRSMKLQSRRGESFSSLIRITAPADIKGTAFLADISSKEESQWLYLPSTKQVRRVVGTKKSAGILGSELTMEDLNSTAIKSSSLKVLKFDDKLTMINLIPNPGTSAYSRVVITLSTKDKLPLRTTYYIGNDIKKEVQFKNYKKVGPVWRAQLIEVKNLQNKRGTTLSLSNLKVNSGLKKDDFTPSALKPN